MSDQVEERFGTPPSELSTQVSKQEQGGFVSFGTISPSGSATDLVSLDKTEVAAPPPAEIPAPKEAKSAPAATKKPKRKGRGKQAAGATEVPEAPEKSEPVVAQAATPAPVESAPVVAPIAAEPVAVPVAAESVAAPVAAESVAAAVSAPVEPEKPAPVEAISEAATTAEAAAPTPVAAPVVADAPVASVAAVAAAEPEKPAETAAAAAGPGKIRDSVVFQKMGADFISSLESAYGDPLRRTGQQRSATQMRLEYDADGKPIRTGRDGAAAETDPTPPPPPPAPPAAEVSVTEALTSRPKPARRPMRTLVPEDIPTPGVASPAAPVSASPARDVSVSENPAEVGGIAEVAAKQPLSIRTYVTNPETVDEGPISSYILYDIVVKGNFEPPILGNSFKTKKRYSQFDALRVRLMREESLFPEQLAPFPPKQVFGRFEPTFVEARRTGLQTFLQAACNAYPDSPSIRAFLTSDAISLARDSLIDLSTLPLPGTRRSS